MSSPHILLNSGVGPKDEIENVGVKSVHNLPGVGKNFHDHVSYMMTFSVNEEDGYQLNWSTAMDYILRRKGPLSSTGKRFLNPNHFLNPFAFTDQ